MMKHTGNDHKNIKRNVLSCFELRITQDFLATTTENLGSEKSDKLVRKEQVRSEVRTQNMLFYGNQLGNHTKYLPF